MARVVSEHGVEGSRNKSVHFFFACSAFCAACYFCVYLRRGCCAHMNIPQVREVYYSEYCKNGDDKANAEQAVDLLSNLLKEVGVLAKIHVTFCAAFLFKYLFFYYYYFFCPSLVDFHFTV
jgi:hypothetical protein